VNDEAWRKSKGGGSYGLSHNIIVDVLLSILFVVTYQADQLKRFRLHFISTSNFIAFFKVVRDRRSLDLFAIFDEIVTKLDSTVK
jgi:hypothetical protein